jgi:hypothetical protein
MDVQAATATLPYSPQTVPLSGVAQPPAPDTTPVSLHPLASAPAPALSAPGSSDPSSAGGSGNPAIGPTPGLATLPAGASPGSQGKNPEDDPTLSTNVAKLFNAQEQNVSVSFHVEKATNEIVTVFTDKQTGKVIVQFPSETLIALAQFFDKLDGSVVNKKV